MLSGLSYLDILVLGAVAISGTVALYQGFLRETLTTIVCWPVAGIASIYFAVGQPIAVLRMAHWFDIPFRGAEFCVGFIFFLLMIVVVHSSILLYTAPIVRGSIDRLLGLLFGVVRGFVLVVIPFMFYESFVERPEQQYPWVRDAVSRPYIKSIGDSLRIMLQRMVPSTLMGPEQQQGQLLQDHNNAVVDADGKRVRVVLYPARPTAHDA